MPTLDFKGKQYIYSHHHSVPFRELLVDNKKSLPASGKKPSLDDNLIIHGDNLHALKALMPHYAGKINCIYIDPPYNTGNEGWCYNDNVNSPLMKEWLDKNANPVDKEDMQRHDKWLCMMYPRLKLLHELLADDGVIFVSIDDNEVHNLRAAMDDIFGEENFYSQVIIRANSRGQTYNQIAKTHEYVLLYAKTSEIDFGELNKDEENNDLNFSDKLGKYNVRELRNRNPKFGKHNRPNLFYPIFVNTNSADKDGFFPVSLTDSTNFLKVEPFNSVGKESCWRWGEDKSIKNIALDTQASNLVAKRKQDGGYLICEKYRKTTFKPKSIWDDNKFLTESGTVELNAMGIKEFQFPKPIGLIKQCVQLCTNDDDIILDSFAGSGTTAHAVLALNKEDGGNRKFILVEMEDYADTVTAERVRRVINGVPTAKDEKLKAGLGGSFTFCELGKEISIEKIITGESLPDYGALASYVFYTATGKSLDGEAKEKLDYFVGETDLYEVYLIYKPDISFLRSNDSALNDVKLKAIAARNSKKEKLVFATAKYMGQKELSAQNISFCQLPYAIHKVVGA
jgi:adenine-specific DNA-methyltransferase